MANNKKDKIVAFFWAACSSALFGVYGHSVSLALGILCALLLVINLCHTDEE